MHKICPARPRFPTTSSRFSTGGMMVNDADGCDRCMIQAMMLFVPRC